MKTLLAFIVSFCVLFQSPMQAKVDYKKIANESVKILVQEYVQNILKDVAKDKIEEVAQKYVEQVTIDSVTKGAEILGSIMALNSFMNAETDKAKGFIALNYFLPPEPTTAAIMLVVQLADAAMSAQQAKEMMELQVKLLVIAKDNALLDQVDKSNLILSFTEYTKEFIESKLSIEGSSQKYEESCFDIQTENEYFNCTKIAFRYLVAIQTYFYTKAQLEVLVAGFEVEEKVKKSFYSKEIELNLNYLVEELRFTLKDSNEELLNIAIESLHVELKKKARKRSFFLVSKMNCRNKLMNMDSNFSVNERRAALKGCGSKDEK